MLPGYWRFEMLDTEILVAVGETARPVRVQEYESLVMPFRAVKAEDWNGLTFQGETVEDVIEQVRAYYCAGTGDGE